jgi:hypothetical protein
MARERVMKITVATLKRIVTEAVRMHERYMSRDDAEELIASMDGDAIVPYDIIDEESGEIYAAAGDAFNESSLSPDYKPKPQPALSRKRGKPAPIEDDDDEEDYFDKLAREEDEARAAWHEVCKEYAANWRGWAYEHAEEYGLDDPDQAAQGSASDAADGFFHTYGDWRQ